MVGICLHTKPWRAFTVAVAAEFTIDYEEVQVVGIVLACQALACIPRSRSLPNSPLIIRFHAA
jgi:hypothetical protein